MVTKTDSPRTSTPPAPMVRALVFDLDSTVFFGRACMFELIRGQLKGKGIDFTASSFEKYCAAIPVSHCAKGLEKMASKLNLSLEAEISAVNEQFAKLVESGKLKANAPVVSLLEHAAKDGVPMGALSFLPEPQARALLGRLGLEGKASLQCITASARFTLSAWRAILHPFKLVDDPDHAVALTSCQASAFAAIGAGMRCVTIPDEFTAHQDLTGVDLVADDPKELHYKTVMALLSPCGFRPKS